MLETVTTFDWNRVPPESIAKDRELVLPSVRSGDIGAARMERLLTQFLSSREFPRLASIADIHGNVEGLRRELTLCRQYEVDNIVCTGDLLDRDPHSIAVVNELRAASNHFKLDVSLGNHDFFCLRAIAGSRRDLVTWLGNGGTSVLLEPEVGLASLATILIKEAAEAGMPLQRWIRSYLAEETVLLDHIMKVIQANDCLNQVYAWMKDNLYLSYLSSIGFLYIHAGIPTHANGTEALEYKSDGKNWHGLWALAKAEEDIFSAFDQKLPAHPAYGFLEHAQSPVWIRDWESAIESDEGRCNRLVESLGVTGVVTGHTVQPRTKSLHQGRLILADRGLAQVYNNQPGVILMLSESGADCITAGRRQLSPYDLLQDRAERARKFAGQILAARPS